MTERTAVGDEISKRLLGEAVFGEISAQRAKGGFGSFFFEHAHSACFGDIWARPGLDLKSRSLVTIAMVAALRATDQIKLHVIGAINHGSTVSEIEEVLYQTIPYLGFPTALIAIKAAKEALTEAGCISP